jgi:hypothetical protein
MGIIADFSDFEDEVDKNGILLIRHVEPFREYDFSNGKEVMRIVIIGAVKKPGVYIFAAATSLQDAIDKAIPLQVDGYAVSAYLNKVNLFRKGESEKKVAINGEDGKFLCADGDVVKIRAVKF